MKSTALQIRTYSPLPYNRIHLMRLLFLLSVFIAGIFFLQARELFPKKSSQEPYQDFPIGDHVNKAIY